LLSARFLPELNPVGAGLAGATGLPPVRFLLSALGSAVLWASAWAGAGYALTEAITR
jgi:membrane protein DedA with SNARE-associated domain